MIATVSNSLLGGIRRSSINLIGLQLAIIVHLSIVVIGLGALLASSTIAFSVLKYVGASYLVYLGIQKFFAKVRVKDNFVGLDNKKHYVQLIREGFIINLMNPKSIIFLAAFLPQFINTRVALNEQYMILGATVVVCDVIVMSGYAYLAEICRTYFINERFLLMQNRFFGGIFILMGILLMLLER